MIMTLWDHFGKSLPLPATIFLVLLTLITWSSPIEATSYCSNSFRFDQLCPDPRFGSRESSLGLGHQPDTFIQLPNIASRRMNGGSTATQSGGSMSIKDPSTTSCDFHRNGVETAVLTGVHISENPWSFRHATACNNIVKLSYDLFENVGNQGQPERISVIRNASNKKEKTCTNEIGIRRNGYSEDAVAANDELADELARKTNVYFWHNFTVYPHSVQFSDMILNYHFSKEDISCVDSKSGHYVQIAIVVHRGGRCEMLVQQYKISQTRSPWGCTGAVYNIPHPIQFCGAYECSQINRILTGFKLVTRRDDSGVHYRAGIDEVGDVTTNENQQPCVTEIPIPTTEPPPEDEELGEGIIKSMDWREIMFLCTFPLCGVFFIVIVLNILRSHSAREICRGYTYPRPDEGLGYHPSTCPIDKSLPI